MQAPSTDIAVSELSHASAEVSEIVFFLLGAMTIVEIVDAHQGFKLVTDIITTRKPRTLLWVVNGLQNFFFYQYIPQEIQVDLSYQSNDLVFLFQFMRNQIMRFNFVFLQLL